MTEEDYREELARIGVKSSKELTSKQARDFINKILIGKYGFIPTTKDQSYKRGMRKDDPITPTQQERIQAGYMAIKADSLKAQMKLNERACKRPWPQTIEEGQKVINMLNNMVRKGYKLGGDGAQEATNKGM